MLTLHDICEKLKRLDEVTVMELLEIRTEDLVSRFMFEIEERSDYLESILDDN